MLIFGVSGILVIGPSHIGFEWPTPSITLGYAPKYNLTLMFVPGTIIPYRLLSMFLIESVNVAGCCNNEKVILFKHLHAYGWDFLLIFH